MIPCRAQSGWGGDHEVGVFDSNHAPTFKVFNKP